MSDDLEVQFLNADGTLIEPVQVKQPSYDEYLDKAKKLSLRIAKPNAVDPQGTVLLTRHGSIKLIGHIDKVDSSNPSQDTITCSSAEDLLEDRYGQFYRYPAGTTLNAMLSDQPGGSVAGMLTIANGLIPRGGWVLHSGKIYKLSGAGTTSRLGTLTSLYQNTTALTKAAAIPTAAGQFYQNAAGLYIWTTDGKNPNYHLIIAPNYKDTLVRLGTITGGTATFDVVFEIGDGKLLSTIRALLLAKGLEDEWEPSKDGKVYLNGKTAIGKGSSSAPVRTFIDRDNCEISTTPSDSPYRAVQALVGQGAGSGRTKQCAAAFDFVTRGTWREAIYSAPGTFGSMLKTATEKVFSDRSDSTIYAVEAPEQDWSLGRGDWVRIVREKYQPVTRRVKHISMKSSGGMSLECGQRLRTMKELLTGEQEISKILESFNSAHTQNAWSWNFNDLNLDSLLARTVEFVLKSSDEEGQIDTSFPYVVTLDLKVGWYKTDISKVTETEQTHTNVGNHSDYAHGNVGSHSDYAHGNVGSHSGYGGKSTSSESMTAHGVNSIASATESAQVVITRSSSSTGSGGGGSSGATSSGGSPAHSHSYVMPIYHSHGIGQEYYGTVADSNHTHPIPSHNTNAAGSQSHVGATDSAKTRAGSSEHGTATRAGSAQHGTATRAGSSTHPEKDSELAVYIKEHGTGNSVHYLALTVLVNGSAIAGSPFNNLYIGDSLSDIDISDLVRVGQNNIITLSVSEWGGSGPVKCAVSGGVQVNSIISAF